MPCLLGCIALLVPRVVIVLLVIFGDYIGRAYETTLWPLLGFIFLPLTTLVYAWVVNSGGSVELINLNLVLVILAGCIDLGIIGGGTWPWKRKRLVR